ncbi:MAG: hypothetical protein IKU30_00675 [Clostridia bacterium]|nr:hypothetical protein [Clostridia bacterium]
MKKRFFAFLTAIFMILSVFVLASCEDEVVETSSEAESQQELTARELFTASLLKAAISGANTGDLSLFKDILFGDQSKDTEGKIEVNVNKLSAEGVDLASLGKIGMTADVKADIETESAMVDYNIFLLGETVDAGIFVENGTKVYLTNILGAIEKPVLMQDGSAVIEGGAIGSTIGEIDPAVIETLLEDIIKAITENVKDEDFTKSTETVTVDGKTIENATVVTLTIGNDASRSILTKITDSINSNEEIVKLFGEELTLAEDEIPLSTKIVNTIVNEKSVALAVTVECPEDKADESAASDEDTAEDDDPEYNKFVVKADYLDGNFNLVLGPANDEGNFFDEHGYIKVAYKLENEKESFVFALIGEGKEQELIKLDGTNKNGERKGKLTLEVEGEGVTIEYSLSGSENNGNIQLGPVTVTSDGETIELDFNYTASYTITETTINVSGEINFAMEGGLDLSADYSVSCEFKDVTFEPINDYVDVEDFDESVIEDAFTEKCPNIYAMLNGNESEELYYYVVDDRLELCLPDGFEYEEDEIEGYTAVIYNDDVTIFVIEEKFADIGADLTLDDYISFLHACVGDNASEIFDDYLPYFIYENSEYGMHYFVTAYEGEDSFWLVQYLTTEDLFNDYYDSFIEWAQYSGVVYEHVDESF